MTEKRRPWYRAVSHEWVQLEEWEAREAWERGKTLRDDALRDGRHDKPGLKEPERKQSLGTLGERGIAKLLGLYSKNESLVFRKPDLEHDIEAKIIGDTKWGLRVDPTYPLDLRIVGIVIPKGNDPRGCAPGPWSVPGWCFVRDALELATVWDLRIPAPGPLMLAMPQYELRSLDGLRALMRGVDPSEVAVKWPRGSNRSEYEAAARVPEPVQKRAPAQQIALF